MVSELNLPFSKGTPIDLLAAAHRKGGAGAGTPEYEKLCMDLSPTGESFLYLATMAVHGDPEHWPGLTAPAVDVLGTHFQAMAAGGEERGRAFHAQIMTDALQLYESSLEQYERLAPALKGLAALLPYLPAPNKYGASATRQMAELLRSAPTGALAGPLQPLVQAFRQRILSGKISVDERRVLEQSIADQVLGGQIEEAFRPIADVL